jgi:hypothetical protein
MHSTCSCGVDIVIELVEYHQLAHARKLGIKEEGSEYFLLMT